MIIHVMENYLYSVLLYQFGPKNHRGDIAKDCSANLTIISPPHPVTLIPMAESATSKRPGWWLTYPSEKYEFVSWDDEIPN
jgi:hypothetical protein